VYVILLIEPDTARKKKLSDLLSHEKTISKSTLSEAVEVLCKHKKDIDLIITEVQVLSNEVERQTIGQLCRRLYLETPPILGIYTKTDAEQVSNFKKISKHHRLLFYDENDPGFPVDYLQVVTELFPGVACDLEKAMTVWNKNKRGDIGNLHERLKGEGISIEERNEPGAAVSPKEVCNSSDESDNAVSLTQDPGQRQEPVPAVPLDFEKMYYDLKKKYDVLLKLMHELTAAVKGTNECK
jgi:hypothetical protein